MTNERVLIDTNVLIYARDDRYPKRQAEARHWLAALKWCEAAIVSPQVLSGMHSVALRGLSPVGADDSLRTDLAIKAWCHGVTDIVLVHAPWVPCQRTGFPQRNCWILAAAHRTDRWYLSAEDYQHSREVGGTTIFNPLQVAPRPSLPFIRTDHGL